MIAASWICSVCRSVGLQKESRSPVPIRIQRAHTSTVWPKTRSSDRTEPTNELSPFEVSGFGGAGARRFAAVGLATGGADAGFHCCSIPSQYQLPSGEI